MSAERVDPLAEAHWEHIQALVGEIVNTALLLPEFRDAPISYIVSRINPFLFEAIYAKGFAHKWEPGKRRPVPKYLRDLVFDRDKHTCVSCGHGGRPKNPLTVDHIKPVVRGGLTILENLQTMCHDCNQTKGRQYDDGIPE